MIGGSLDTGEGDPSAVNVLLARARLSQKTPRIDITPIEKPLAPDDVILVDANGGAGLAAEPPKATASAPVTDTAAPAPSTASAEDQPPAQPEPPRMKPEPPYQGRDVTPKAPPPPKPKWNGAPADFRRMKEQSEFVSAQRTTERDQLMEAKVTAARAKGICQLPPSEVLPADEADRQPQEIVNFTRIPGGRGVRRC